MTAFNMDGYSLILGDHETGIWCQSCTGAITGDDRMQLSFNCDFMPLTFPALHAAARAHHNQHHATPAQTCPACSLIGTDQAPEIIGLLGHDTIGHRATNALKREGIYTAAQLRAYRDDELLDLRNFGRLCLGRVRAAIPEGGTT